MSKCKIVKKGEDYDLLPVIDFILDKFHKAKMNAMDPKTFTLDFGILRKELKKALHEIGDLYYASQLNLIELAFNEALEEEVPLFKNFFPKNIMGHIKQSTRLKAEEIDKESYESFETPGNPEFESDSYFLDVKFGFDTRLKEQIKKRVSNNLLNSFIINRDRTSSTSGYIVQTIEEGNENIRQYKQRLFDIVLNYLKTQSSDIPESVLLFDGKEYIATLPPTLLESLEGLRATDQNEILKKYNNSDKNSEDRLELEAIEALFILDNFDNFVNLLLRDVITIKPGTKNKLTSGDNYTFSEKGHHVIVSWRTDDNIVMESEIGALTQILVNSTPFVNFGTNNFSDQYIKFEDFYRIITKIKDLALNENLATIITGKESWVKLLSEKELEAIKGKSLRNIITNIRLNPLIYTRVAFTALCNLSEIGNVTDNKSALTRLGFNEEELDKLWSIYKGFFDSSDEFSIKGIQNKYNYGTVKNYYEVATLAVDSMFSVDYMRYSESDNIITVSSLKDSDLEKTRYEIQSNILQSNSRNIIQNGFIENHWKPYKAELIYELDKNKKQTIAGIKLKPIKGLTLIWNFKADKKNSFTIEGDLNSFIDGDSEIPVELKKFIDALLNLDLTFDSIYYKSLDTVYGGRTDEMLTTLLKLSTKVLFNKYVSNVIFLGENKSEAISGKTNSTQKLKQIYGNKSELIPRYNNILMEIDLLAQEDAFDLRSLAKAKLLATGQAQSSSVKDAEGNLLSTQTLSRELGNLAFQHDEILDTSKRFKRSLAEIFNNGQYISKQGTTYQILEVPGVPVLISDSFIGINEEKIAEQFDKLDSSVKVNFLDLDEYATYLIEYGIATNGTFNNLVISNRVIRNLNYRRNAASGFSLLKPGFYTGFYTEKEFKGAISKARTEFTPAEAMQASFLHSFIGGLITKTNPFGKEVVGNGNIGLLPSVNSDKNTMGEAVFNLNKNLKETGRTWKDIIESTDPTDMKLLEEAICEELGEAYQISLNNIKSDFIELISWLQENKQLLIEKGYDEKYINSIIPDGHITIDPESDFKELNAFAASINYKTADLLFEWTKLYNNNNTDTIKLIDQTHFINTGKSIKFNNTFKRLLERYKDTAKFSRFMDMKRSELLVSLLNENFSINLQGDFEDTIDDTPKKYLTNESKFGLWFNKGNKIHKVTIKINGEDTTVYGSSIESLYLRAKEKGYNKSFETFKNLKRIKDAIIASTRGKMILAKVTIGDRTLDIIHKDDLKHLRNLVEGRPDFLLNPHELFNPKYGLKVELHPMLDKYNTLDYFLTQEYMIAGVGTHTNHPGKAKYKTPIIWGHPAIGKTYALDEKGYGNQIIDWDVEFNRRRDEWIANATKTEIGTKEFKTARNEYMIHYDRHQDFIDFVTSEWKRVKELANSQNKILLASPHMLLDLFPEDFDKVITMSLDDFVTRNVERGANDKTNSIEWKKGIDTTLTKYTSNPDNVNKVITAEPGMYLSDMLQNDMLFDEVQQILENDILEEAARFLAQHKRNVSYTAAMYPFLLNLISGVPTEYNMAIIDDIKSAVYTITGDYDLHKPFDGATFVNPLVVYWENNSLQENKAGIDKKQFVHFYDPKTGTGGIIKTAGFGVTNNRAKKDKFYRDMAYNMMKRNWKNKDGSQHISEKGIFVDFLGNTIDYQDIFFEKDGKYYHRTIKEYTGNNLYVVTDVQVDMYGDPVEDATENSNTVSVNSNYDVWMLLGGYNSQELVNGVLLNSEISLKRTADLANSYGLVNEDIAQKIKENPNLSSELIQTAEDVYQPMKYSDIHYMPTVGAIKQGGGNINPSSHFYGHHELNFMKVRMTQAGIQLDKEHHADNSVLSLMTQVISAACSRGYTKNHALKLYKALEQLTKLGTKEFRNELGNLVIGDDTKFNEAVSNILLLTILTSKSNDDDMLQVIAKDIIREVMTSTSFSFDKTTLNKFDKTVPYSDNPVFNKIVSSLTVALTKSGIKTKMPGILSVLCPTQDIIKFYKIPVLDAEGNPTGRYKRVSYGQLEKELKLSDELLDQKLDELQDNEEALVTTKNEIDFSKIDVGYKYLVTYKDVNGEEKLKIVHVGGPHRFEDELNLGSRIYKNESLEMVVTGYKNLKEDSSIVSIKEWIKDGQDLKAYSVKFTGDDNVDYQMCDLDIVQDYFEIKQAKTSFDKIVEKLIIHECFDELCDRISKDLLNAYSKNELFEPDPLVLAEEARLLDEYDAIKEKLVEDISEADEKAIKSLLDKYNTSNFGKYRARRAFNDSYKLLQQLVADLSTTKTLYSEDEFELSKQKAIVKQFNKYVKDMAIKGINRLLLLTLDGISPSSSRQRVKINGNYVLVNPESIVKKCYGAIMPKTFKSNFGLDQFDLVEDIKNDPDFFVKKLASKLDTKVEGYVDQDGYTVNNFHLELKKPDGNHVYIRKGNLSTEDGDIISGLKEEVPIFTITESDGTIYRVDGNLKKMYQLFSKDDKVYKDIDGNEVIVTSDITEYVDSSGKVVSEYTVKGKNVVSKETGEKLKPVVRSGIRFYLDKLDYITFNISEHCSDNEFNYVLSLAMNSSNEDSKNLAVKINKIKRTSDLQKARNYVNSLNDYSTLLDSNGKLKSGVHKDIEMRLRSLGRKMHTSFLQSLNIIAARIPAQSLQSFMPMEIEAFEDPDVNTAYVSTFQFYLQGSDLDIDAVSLQTFDIDKNGLLVGHSPYYSLESESLRKASEDLPFPTGEKTELISAEFNNLTFIEKYDYLFGDLIQVEYNTNDGVRIKFNTTSSRNIKLLSDLIEEVNLNRGILVHQNFSEDRLNSLAKLLDKIYPEEQYGTVGKFKLENIEEALADAFDRHNLYLQKASVNKRLSIIRNYITTLLFNISSDPINLIESQSSVDTMTSTAKDLAKLSPKATVQNHFTPGNVMNKFLSISENMVGKDGIAICATGLKSFFALTEMYQLILNVDIENMLLTELEKLLLTLYETNPEKLLIILDDALKLKKAKALEKKKSLLFSRTIAGKTYTGLANGYSEMLLSYQETHLTEDDLNGQFENFSQTGYDYLLDQLWSSDAANEMSALLSLSTDNAKELVLAKINAGTGTIGMYLYGLSLGMSFDSIYNIMTSPLAFRLAELTKGNVFNKESGQIDILSVIKYLRREPKKQISEILSRAPIIHGSDYYNTDARMKEIFTKCIDELFADHPQVKEYKTYKLEKKRGDGKEAPFNPYNEPVKFIVDNITLKINKDNKSETQRKQITVYDVKRVLDSLRPAVLTSNEIKKLAEELVKAMHFKSVINQAIDFVLLYIDDASLLKSRPKYYNIYGRLDLVSDIEQLAMGATEMKEIGKILRLNQEIKTNATDLIKQVANIEEAITRRIKVLKSKYPTLDSIRGRFVTDHQKALTKAQLNEAVNMLLSDNYEETYRIDLEKFLTDEKYRNKCIELYNLIKQSYNPLQILAEVPHYRGYVESMYIAYKGLKNKSVKFRVLSDYTMDWIKSHGVGSALLPLVVKNTSDAVNLYLRQEWMKSKDLRIVIPAGSHAFTSNLTTAKITKVNLPIQLGTDVGDANFKLWMEEVMIPRWKKMHPHNKFIQNLKPLVNTNTNRGTVGISFGLPINMMPKSDYEKSLFNEYMHDFNSLGIDEKCLDYSIQDLLYLYSLITTNGKMGPRSLHKIFTNYIGNKGPGSLPYSYREFINMKDSNPNTYKEIIKFLGDGYMIAPITTPSGNGGTLIRYRDVEKGNMLLLGIPKSTNNSDDDFDMDDVQGVDMEGLIEGDQDDITQYEEGYDLILTKVANYGRYKQFKSILIGGNANPIYFLNTFNSEKTLIGEKSENYGDFKIKTTRDGNVVSIEGLTEDAKKHVDDLIKVANRSLKITLTSVNGKRTLGVTSALNSVKKAIDKINKGC